MNPVIFSIRSIDRGVEIEINILLRKNKIHQHGVPDIAVPAGIAVQIFQKDFLDNTVLARKKVEFLRARRTVYRNVMLRAGIAADIPAVVDERNFGAAAIAAHTPERPPPAITQS